MRSFIALDLPAEARRAAAQVADGLKNCGADVKWVRPQAMHLTLKFLGEVDPGRVGELSRGLEAACRGFEALEMELSGCGAFPGLARPQVIWVGLDGELEPLRRLAAAVEQQMQALGFAPERRPFKPHLTLGRVRRGRKGRRGGKGGQGGMAELKRRLAGLASWRGVRFTAGKLALFESTLTPQGAIYRVLHQIDLPAGQGR